MTAKILMFGLKFGICLKHKFFLKCVILQTAIMRTNQFLDITGNRYGRAVAIAYRKCERTTGKGRVYSFYEWDCICDCGNVFTTRGGRLRSGVTQSCGCYYRESLAERNKPINNADRLEKMQLANNLRSAASALGLESYSLFPDFGLKKPKKFTNPL